MYFILLFMDAHQTLLLSKAVLHVIDIVEINASKVSV